MAILCIIKSGMNKIITLLLFAITLSGCKKAIENIQEDLVIKAMTDGQWKVTSFIQNGTDITVDFSTYRFKYYSDKTVDAIKSGIFEKKGICMTPIPRDVTWHSNVPEICCIDHFLGKKN